MNSSTVEFSFLFIHLFCLIIYWNLISSLIEVFVTNSLIDHICIILLDSSTHAVIGILIWSYVIFKNNIHSSSVLNEFFNNCFSHAWDLLLSGFLSSLLDIDHFLEAKSWSLFDATHLSHRPFGHSLLFIFIFILVYMLISKDKLSSLRLFLCWFSHQLRDSIKHGLWIGPMLGSTPLLTLPWILIIYFLMMIIGRILYNRLQTSSFLEDIRKNDIDIV